MEIDPPTQEILPNEIDPALVKLRTELGVEQMKVSRLKGYNARLRDCAHGIILSMKQGYGFKDAAGALADLCTEIDRSGLV